MGNIATLKETTRMTLLATLMFGVVGFAHSQAGAGAGGAGGASSAAGAGVASGGATGGAAGAGVAAGAAAVGRGSTSSSVPGLGGLASEPGGAAPPGKKGPPSISGANSGRSPGMAENPSTLPGATK